MQPLRTLIIDNYDSYTFNLLQLMANQVVVIRNDQFEWPEFSTNVLPYFDNIIISPGPGRPDRASDFGICTPLLQAQMDPMQPQHHRPIFGICLGHQGLGHIFGGKVIHAPRIMHGRMSQVHCHAPEGAALGSIFQGCRESFWAVRYHSLVVDPSTVPACLLLTATCAENDADIQALRHAHYLSDDTTTHDGKSSRHHFLPAVACASTEQWHTVMGFQHATLPLWGVQFHPESVSTEHGATMITNFMQESCKWMSQTGRPFNTDGLPPFIRAQSVVQAPADAVVSAIERIQAPYRWQLQVMRSHWVDPEYLVEELLNGDMADPNIHVRSIAWLDSSRKSSPYSQTSILAVDPVVTLRYSTLHRQVYLQYRDGHATTHKLDPKDTFFDYVSRWMRATGNVSMHVLSRGGDGLDDASDVSRFAFQGGLVGYFGYEMKRESMEGYATPDAQQCQCDQHNGNNERVDGHSCCACVDEPDAAFHFVDRFWVFDHAARRSYVCALTSDDPNASALAFAAATELQQPFLAVPSAEDARQWLNSSNQAILQTLQAQHRRRLADDYVHLTPASSTCTTPIPSAAGGGATMALPPQLADLLAPDTQHQDYLQSIQQAVDAIKEGESYEICLTTRFRLAIDDHTPRDLWKMYTRHLRKNNPAPFSAMIQFNDDFCLLSSSPERFLKVEKGIAEMKPIKGTAARCLQCVCDHTDAPCDFGLQCEQRQLIEDERRKQCLWEDVKERAENLMIVDLIRNDLAQVCDPASVQVPKLMFVESYEKVHHLVSTVRGSLLPNVHSVDALKKCFPPGSMTGAPKLRSVQLLDELEHQKPRGVYSGCLGYISLTGDMDFNVVIRTAVAANDTIHQRVNLSVGGGGAITFLSDPEQEWKETLLKTKSVAPSVKEYLDSLV
ncbi:ADC synthase [Gongronella butleri]|nr:ADC synthase [Gongronella butleri]